MEHATQRLLRKGASGQRIGWGIREGFRAYLSGISDLHVETRGVEWDEESGQWLFGIEGQDSTLLRFQGHAGALDIALVGLRIDIDEKGPALVHNGSISIARLSGRALDESPDTQLYTEVSLTYEGSALFGGVYGPWARMDPITVEMGGAKPS